MVLTFLLFFSFLQVVIYANKCDYLREVLHPFLQVQYNAKGEETARQNIEPNIPTVECQRVLSWQKLFVDVVLLINNKGEVQDPRKH